MSTVFQPKDTIKHATKFSLMTGGAGAIVSAVQNTLGNHSYGAAGFLTRTGSTISFFTAAGAAFALTESTVANYRQKEDPYNSASGACAAGFLAGLRSRSIPSALGGCVVFGGIMGGAQMTGELLGDQTSTRSAKKQREFFDNPQVIVVREKSSGSSPSS